MPNNHRIRGGSDETLADVLDILYRRGQYLVAYMEEGEYRLSSKRFETRQAALAYAAGCSPSRGPVVLQLTMGTFDVLRLGHLIGNATEQAKALGYTGKIAEAVGRHIERLYGAEEPQP